MIHPNLIKKKIISLAKKINNLYYKTQDIEFSPFDDNFLASAYENNFIFIWKKPEGDITENITKEFKIYKKHNIKVNYINFNSIVDNLLCSYSIHNEIYLLNNDKVDNCLKFKSGENPSMISWNPNGDLIGVNTKKNYYIYLTQEMIRWFLNKK